MDTMTPAQRSRTMRAVKGRGTGPERRLEQALRRMGVAGWRRHLKLPGSPDLAFPASRLAVFVHGCFWHACPAHYKAPSSSFRHGSTYWSDKAAANRARDARARQALRFRGWHVLVVWEHEDPATAAVRVHRALAGAQIVKPRRPRT